MDRTRRQLLKTSIALGLGGSDAGARGIAHRTHVGAHAQWSHPRHCAMATCMCSAASATARIPRRTASSRRNAKSPWRGVREALAFGASAPQGGDDGPGSEDCLFLNVTTPGLRDGRRRPILFYIHGGGFNNGSGSDPLYDGTQPVHAWRRGGGHRQPSAQRIRLSLSRRVRRSASPNPATSASSTSIAALQWVREHAAEFGGDAGNVTVFGQSGGGAKIATLMAMPAARGLVPSRMDDERAAGHRRRPACRRATREAVHGRARRARCRCAAAPAGGDAAGGAAHARSVAGRRHARCTSVRCSPARPCRGIRSGRTRHRSPAASRW